MLKTLRRQQQRIRTLCAEHAELAALEAMAAAEDDAAVLADIAASARQLARAIAEEREALRFAGPRDAAGAYLEIQAGAGGLEAQDFACLLLTMYERFCARRGLAARRLNERRNSRGGLRHAVLEVEGRFAYG